MNEKDLDALVRDACDIMGVRRYHTYDSRRSTPGFPDLVLWGRGGLLFRELKSDLGRMSREQIAIRDSLLATPCRACGWHYANESNAYVWRPDDWRNGRIHTELKQISSTWRAHA